MKEKEMFTLHENFGLAHDFLYEIISKKYSEKKLLKTIEDFLVDISMNQKVEVSEEEIDEWIEQCLADLEGAYNETDNISKDEYEKYLILYKNRDRARTELEGISFYTELIASAEYISALLGKSTSSFEFFLELHEFDSKIKDNFQKLQKKYSADALKKLLPNIISSVIDEIKEDETIQNLGIYDENHIEEWKESVSELEENLRSFL